MKVLKKHPGRDFVVLNLTDTQLSNEEWADGHKSRLILERTVGELVERTSPDLITISGDLAWAGQDHAYAMLAELLDSFGIPWAPVFGNHDNQGGSECVDAVANEYLTHPLCVYEKGDPALGNGNYVILIEENGAPCEALIMIDSHDRDPLPREDGGTDLVWSRLTAAQGEWYLGEAKRLKEMGCPDATVILHIPIHAFRYASAAAYRKGVDLKALTLADSMSEDCWNDGYTHCLGVQYEGISCYPVDDGMLRIFKAPGITKHIIAGHDHVNNWIIEYEGVRMIYSLKTGAGCYWRPEMNGGTVLRINENGVYDVRHEYVDVSDLA